MWEIINFIGYVIHAYFNAVLCIILRHKRFEQASFSTWSSTDMQTGEHLGHGFKSNPIKVFCSRCGKDLV